jgi:hypothetical protein
MRYAKRNSNCLSEEFTIIHIVKEFTALKETKIALPLAHNLRFDPFPDLLDSVQVLLTHLFEAPVI